MIDPLSMFKRLVTNEVLSIEKIRTLLLNDSKDFSNDAQKYLLIPQILLGTRDFRARFGSFKDPFGSKCPPAWAPIPLTFIKESITELMDKRAIELITTAKQTGRNITVMWSGGIDSTAMLTAFLKNMNTADHELLTVCLTTQSIVENSEFYFKFISPNKKIKITNASTFEWLTNEFLDKNMLLHGDPGDGVFGPSTSMYQYFSNNGTHLEPWKKHLTSIEELFEPTVNRDMFIHPGLGKWFTNIVVRSMEESGYAEHIQTVADFYWWTYFNFKWAGICTFPLHNGIVNPNHTGISDENYNFYANTVFYNTPRFQNWSYSNLHELVGKDVFKTHKLHVRNYIYEFDNNFQYFSRKRKTSVPPPNNKTQKSSLVGHDKNLKPIIAGTPGAKQALITLLQRYKIT